MWPERCACEARKRDTHALQHCFGISSPNELTIVQQGLPSAGSSLHLVRLTHGASAGAGARSGLKTHCFLLNNVRCNRWRLVNSGHSASARVATARQITSNVVTNI